jgi:hypothetical protein
MCFLGFTLRLLREDVAEDQIWSRQFPHLSSKLQKNGFYFSNYKMTITCEIYTNKSSHHGNLCLFGKVAFPFQNPFDGTVFWHKILLAKHSRSYMYLWEEICIYAYIYSVSKGESNKSKAWSIERFKH